MFAGDDGSLALVWSFLDIFLVIPLRMFFPLCYCIMEAWNLFLLFPGAHSGEIVLSLKRDFGIWTFMQYWS